MSNNWQNMVEAWSAACISNQQIKELLESPDLDRDTKDILKETYNNLNKVFGEKDGKSK